MSFAVCCAQAQVLGDRMNHVRSAGVFFCERASERAGKSWSYKLGILQFWFNIGAGSRTLVLLCFFLRRDCSICFRIALGTILGFYLMTAVCVQCRMNNFFSADLLVYAFMDYPINSDLNLVWKMNVRKMLFCCCCIASQCNFIYSF